MPERFDQHRVPLLARLIDPFRFDDSLHCDHRHRGACIEIRLLHALHNHVQKSRMACAHRR